MVKYLIKSDILCFQRKTRIYDGMKIKWRSVSGLEKSGTYHMYNYKWNMKNINNVKREIGNKSQNKNAQIIIIIISIINIFDNIVYNTIFIF